jgi:membrane protein
MLLKRKKLPAILAMVAAIALHNYSVIFLCIWIISLFRFKKSHIKFFTTIFVILLVMNIFRIDVLFTNMLQRIPALFTGNLLQISHYLLDAEQTTSLKKGILLYLIQNIYLCSLYYKNDTPEITNDFVILLIGSFLAVLINDNAVIRVTNYFFVFQIMLYGKYISGLRASMEDQRTFIMTKKCFVHSIIIILVIPTVTFVYMLRYCSII